LPQVHRLFPRGTEPASPQDIPLADLSPHPDNPRLTVREEVIEQIIAGITANNGFAPEHAILVRPLEGGYQIVSGHNRVEAARRKALTTVPAWVREMTDQEAFMQLVLANAQSELSPLERGRHALQATSDRRMTVLDYATGIGRVQQSVSDEVCAARVAAAIPDIRYDKVGILVAIHAARPWLWPGLVAKAVEQSWTVDVARREVALFKGLPERPPSWAADDFIEAVLSGNMTPRDIQKITEAIAEAKKTIAETARKLADTTPEIFQVLAPAFSGTPERRMEYLDVIDWALASGATPVQTSSPPRFSALSEVMAYYDGILGWLRGLIRERQIAEENARQRLRRLARAVTLDEWDDLSADERAVLFNRDLFGRQDRGSSTFNEQDGADIEWAKYSWNPITGCLHNCPYCYARDIATSTRMAQIYPDGFAPTLWPSRLGAPQRMEVPQIATTDARYRNVFCGSMSDWWGRWVPEEWITLVLDAIRQAPQWQFLTLTKFPKRMAEFELPDNVWAGTTVDLQARVANAEAAFARVNARVKWLSLEPLLEPLRFRHLDRFDWIVIGGAKAIEGKTPEWRPHPEWWLDIWQQAKAAGVKVYWKTNLLGPRLLELPGDLPVPRPADLPEVLRYVGQTG
jgi:ParB/RepB/Spo0J family partition protein